MNSGIKTGTSFFGAANASRNDANKCCLAIDVANERSAGVALARVDTGIGQAVAVDVGFSGADVIW